MLVIGHFLCPFLLSQGARQPIGKQRGSRLWLSQEALAALRRPWSAHDGVPKRSVTTTKAKLGIVATHSLTSGPQPVCLAAWPANSAHLEHTYNKTWLLLIEGGAGWWLLDNTDHAVTPRLHPSMYTYYTYAYTWSWVAKKKDASHQMAR
ncbi:hypothetical protein ACJQWK_05501 [Exserohilum turcicum]